MKSYLIALLLVASAPGYAKPLIQSSEDTLASVCIEYRDTPKRLAEICKLALEEAQTEGASERQILQMRTSLGDAYYELGQYPAALDEFRTVLKEDPTMVSAHLGTGWSELEQGSHDRSRQAFETAYALEVSASAVAGLASVKLATNEIDLDAFIEQLELAVAIRPTYSWALREIGWKLYQNSREAESIPYFTKAIKNDPNDLNAYQGRARAQVYLDGEAALEDINRAIQMDSTDSWSYSLRYEILSALGRDRQSIADAEWMIKNDPDASDGYVQKARALFNLGRGEAALSLLRETRNIENLKGAEFLNYWSAAIMVDSGLTAEAEVELRKTFDQLEPDKYDMRLLAYILLQDDRPQEAKIFVEDALVLDENWALLHVYKARILAIDGQPAEAMDAFDKAHKLGTEEWMLNEFVETLVSKGLFLQALAARKRFSNG